MVSEITTIYEVKAAISPPSSPPVILGLVARGRTHATESFVSYFQFSANKTFSFQETIFSWNFFFVFFNVTKHCCSEPEIVHI
jgi:hypothetical protein